MCSIIRFYSFECHLDDRYARESSIFQILQPITVKQLDLQLVLVP